MLFNARKAVIQDDRADYPRHGNYEYPTQQPQAKKSLPGKKRASLSPVWFAVILAGIVCIYFYANLSAFGFKPTPVNPSTMLNAGQPNVYGKPSLTSAQINTILAKAHSPAAGTGQALYDGSVKSGVNDSFVMGVFNAESQYGTLGAAVANHSVGNLVSNGTLIHYATWQVGYVDFYAKVKAAGEDDPQTTLDHLYIPGLINILDLKKARAGEPDITLVLATIRNLEK
jgi:hypothetical protein